jgi:dihydroorotase
MDNREGMRFSFVILTFAVATFAQQQHDLLLKGGRLIDPKNGIDARMDVAVRDGKVSAVSSNIDASTARQTLDVSGLLVTPGLIDIHVHVYHSPNVKDAWAGANSFNRTPSASAPVRRRWWTRGRRAGATSRTSGSP